MRIKTLMSLAIFSMMASSTYASDVTINNTMTPPPAAPQQAQQSPCPPANQNNIYDPRVPPAGVYTQRNGDGSSSTTYTTGEKKPYIVDNNCNTNPAPQPYVAITPNINSGNNPGPRPGRH